MFFFFIIQPNQLKLHSYNTLIIADRYTNWAIRSYLVYGVHGYHNLLIYSKVHIQLNKTKKKKK